MGKLKKLFAKYQNMNKAAKATIWFVICSFFQRGITVLTTPIFTRLLNTEEYGIYSVFSSWLEIFTVIVTMRISYGAYMRNIIKKPEIREQYASSLQGLTCVQVAVWFVVYFLLRNQVDRYLGLDVPMMLCMFGMILFSTWFSFWAARERVDYNYRKLVGVTVAISILKPLVGIILVLSTEHHKVMARIIGLVAVEFVVYVGMFISQMKKGKVFFHKRYWFEAMKFNLPLVPHYLSQIVLNHSDRIMIDHFCGSDAAGIYSLAYSMAMLLVTFNTSLQNTITPWNYQQLKDKNYAGISKIGNLTSLIVAGANFALILIAPEALKIFAPPSYHEALYVIPPVAMGVYFMFLYSRFINIEMYYGKNKYVMTASVLGAILNIILNWIFIPIFGYIAAAYTTLVSYIFYSSMHYVFTNRIRKQENIKSQIYDIKTLFLISVGFTGISFLMMLTYQHTIIRYGIIAVFVVVMIIFRKKIISIFKEFLSMKKRSKK